MRVTTDHPASAYGVPVILDDAGTPLAAGPGVRAVLAHLGWDKRQAAERCGTSVRTVEGWLQGRPPTVAALNVFRDALEEQADDHTTRSGEEHGP